jgi:hypothetical protein
VGINVDFTLNAKAIDRAFQQLKAGDVFAVVYNDARSEDGTYYWTYVNDGRGPVYPKNAKVLHWIDPKTGNDVFARYAGPSAPRHIREKALPTIQQNARFATAKVGPLGRGIIVEMVNAIASMAAKELAKQTPVVSGTLRDSYKIRRAK